MTSVTINQKPNELTLESIPTVDLRLLTQSELTALSLCSSHAFDLRRCDDVVIPKIDRSVFNESAGSRKQTYSRLRLAPRNKPNLKPRVIKPDNAPILDSERVENDRIVCLFKDLFRFSNGGGGGGGGELAQGDELALVPVPVNFGEVDGNEKRKRGRKPGGCAGGVEDEVVEYGEDEAENVSVEEVVRRCEEREKELVNKNGVVVNLAELAKKEDPYREELRKRTEGRESAEELLGFVTEVEGQWGSTRKKRKIVDANVFGDALPNGWKVLIAIKKKLGRAWVFVRRYVSPNGRHFVSCKEVSSYLLSLTGPQELEEQPTVEVPDILMGDNLASKNAAEIETKIDFPGIPDSCQSNYHEDRQMVLHVSPLQEKHPNQVILSKDVNSGEQNTASASALKCHKCSTPFSEKDELLNHLISCHKRKRQKAGVPMEEDFLMKDGKYECQFCNKIFTERHRYFGHIGNHVKNYAKSIGGTPEVTPKQKMSKPVSAGNVPVTVSDTLRPAELNAESGSEKLNTPAKNEMNTPVLEKINSAVPDPERHLENGNIDQNCSSHQMELNVEAAQTDKNLAREVSENPDAVVNTDNNTVKLDEATGSYNVKDGDCFGADNVLFEDGNDLCEIPQEINNSDCVSSEVRKSPALMVDSVDLGNDDSFAMADVIGNEGILSSEFDLPANDEEKSSHQISGYESLVNDIFHENSFDEVNVGDDEGMTDGGSAHIDIVLDGEDDINGPEILEESSALPQREEESCAVTNNIGSKGFDFRDERGEETSFSTNDDQLADIGMQNKRRSFADLVNDSETSVCNLEGIDVAIDTDMNASERRSESSGLCFPTNYGPTYIGNQQTCSVENSTVKKGNDHTSNLFFTSRSTDCHVDANSTSNNGQAHNQVSNVLGGFSSFVEDKQSHVPKSLLSCLSMKNHSHEVVMDDVRNVSSTTTTMHFPGLDKVDDSRSNKSIHDFGNMTEMNGRFMNPVQHNTAPQDSSPFQLWGQQSCPLEDNQNKVYNNNSLNRIGFQKPSGGENNLNKVSMNEQRYVQHNEIGIFRSNEGRRESISHDNTLNLTGFSQQRDSVYNSIKPFVNQTSYNTQHPDSGSYNNCDQTRQERMAYGNSLSLASVQQCDTRYSLNKGYINPMEGFSKMHDLGHSQDRDFMIGFGNNTARPNQNPTTEFLWRSTEGNNLPNNLVESSSSRGQSSGTFQAFDFLSDKGGNDLYTDNEKFDNMSNFDGLRSSIEPMEFSFMTTQEPNTQLEQHQKEIQYNPQMNQSFGSLPNMMTGQVVSTICVWCETEFHQHPLACEMQAGSIGYLCPNCKARMSGQYL